MHTQVCVCRKAAPPAHLSTNRPTTNVYSTTLCYQAQMLSYLSMAYSSVSSFHSCPPSRDRADSEPPAGQRAGKGHLYHQALLHVSRVFFFRFSISSRFCSAKLLQSPSGSFSATSAENRKRQTRGEERMARGNPCKALVELSSVLQ